MKKITKVCVSAVLTLGLLFSGLSFNLPFAQASDLKNPEFTKLKQNLETNGLLYITENNIDSQKEIDFNKAKVTTNLSTLKGQGIQQIDSKFKNVVVDADELQNQAILSKVRELYQKGTKIVIKKDNLTFKEAYNFVGETLDVQDQERSNNKLTTVAISMFKDSSGIVRAARMNVELNNQDEALRTIIIALRDDNEPLRLLFNSPKKQAFIQTVKPALASLSTSWPYVKAFSDYSSWTSVDLNYAVNVYKNPNNPSNGQYYDMEETPFTVTPRSGYYSGSVYLYHTSATSGKVNYYAPQAQTNASSISTSFGYPPSSTLSFTFGTKTNIVINTGGLGYNYIQWRFYPVGIIGTEEPTPNQTYYEPTSQYYQSGSFFNQGLSYEVQMWTKSGAIFTYLSSASDSGIYAGGN